MKYTKHLGFSYIELTISIVIASILMIGLHNILNTSTKVKNEIQQTNQTINNAKTALQRMVFFIENSRQLIIPLTDNPNTDWPENLREQTYPASPPNGSSTMSSAVLALVIPDDFDLDKDGHADADDDKDGQIDEDIPNDMTKDNAAGIVGIDDDGDGRIDEDLANNDDEDSQNNEEIFNNLDDDNDGSIDEDVGQDMNNDACSGICLLDDDGDGTSDEDAAGDDDEDGTIDEDPLNPIVFYLHNGDLIERLPTPWDQTGDNQVDGTDYIESILVSNVTRLRFERTDNQASTQSLIHIIIESKNSANDTVMNLETHVRLGSNL